MNGYADAANDTNGARLEKITSTITMNGDGFHDESMGQEDPHTALQILRTYAQKDGISIDQLMDEAKQGGLYDHQFSESGCGAG